MANGKVSRREERNLALKEYSAAKHKRTQYDIYTAECEHKENNGKPAIAQKIGDTKFRCAICGEIVNVGNIKKQELISAVQLVNDAMQQIKFYGALPELVLESYAGSILDLKDLVRTYDRVNKVNHNKKNQKLSANNAGSPRSAYFPAQYKGGKRFGK